MDVESIVAICGILAVLYVLFGVLMGIGTAVKDFVGWFTGR